MKKLHMFALAVGVVVALSAFTVSPAFAVSKILANGEEITSSLSVQILGSIILKNLGNGAEVLCEGIFDGNIEPTGVLGFITEILSDGGVLTSGTANNLEKSATGDLINCTPLKICENNPTPVTALGLPFHVEVELEGTAFLLDFLEETEVTQGYSVSCKIIGITVPVFCDMLVRATLLLNASGDLAAEFPQPGDKTLCSDGNEGEIFSDPVGTEFEIVDTADGALLTLSE